MKKSDFHIKLFHFILDHTDTTELSEYRCGQLTDRLVPFLESLAGEYKWDPEDKE